MRVDPPLRVVEAFQLDLGFNTETRSMQQPDARATTPAA
jgi:hypothetical protein